MLNGLARFYTFACFESLKEDDDSSEFNNLAQVMLWEYNETSSFKCKASYSHEYLSTRGAVNLAKCLSLKALFMLVAGTTK